jgi:hypothetical protein
MLWPVTATHKSRVLPPKPHLNNGKCSRQGWPRSTDCVMAAWSRVRDKGHAARARVLIDRTAAPATADALRKALQLALHTPDFHLA